VAGRARRDGLDGDHERGLRLARRVRSGSFGINHYAFDLNSPATMIKASGLGLKFGPEALAGYQRFQSLYL
jgi:aldehyde dehydrogenase (NAD+)